MENKNSRTKNSIYNFVTSIGAQFVTVVMSFICRTVFIHKLGESYLGISGLFSNILSMLSLAELGVGTAILYRLYEPLAEKNIPKIQSWMHFYKNAYRVIAVVVACLGLCLIPFLPVLINDYDKFNSLGINAIVVFCLFLLKSVSSYLFFSYRSAIVKADQKQYILTIVSYITIITTNILQILALVLFKDFIIYIVISVVMTVVENIVYAIISQKLYPYINQKPKEKVSKKEVKDTIKDCSALFLYRVNGIVLKSTDNIVLSIFMGLVAIARYSNYLIFYSTINTLIVSVFNSIVHSVGNLHTTKKVEHEYLIFKIAIFSAMLLGSTAGVGIFVVADEFVNTWIGAEWVISQPFSMIMGIELFTVALCTALAKFRNAMGLFKQAKYRPIFSSIVNVVASIVFVKIWGISGVILGTIIAYWTTFLVFDPIVLHKHGFNGKYPVKSFYFTVFGNIAITFVIGFVLKAICSHTLPGMGWVSVVVHTVICAIITPLALCITNWKREEVQYLISILKRKILKSK